MTKFKVANHNFTPGASRGPRSAGTLRLQMARDLAFRLAIAERLRELRRPLGNGRYEIKQPTVADAVGITLRAYQAWELGESEPEFENLKRVAEFHGRDPHWILHGDREPSQLDRMEATLDQILALLNDPAAAADREEQALAAEAQRSVARREAEQRTTRKRKNHQDQDT